ncbi:MAG: ribonuclease R [Longimicrobiales bacterium]
MSRRPDAGIEERTLAALAASNRGPLKAKDLARTLGIPNDGYRRFKKTLAGMERAGKIYRVKGNRYGLPDAMDLVTGAASMTRSGDAFIRPDGKGEDVYVPSLNLATAMDGDRVVVRIESRPRQRNPVGRVIKILERARATVVGTLHHGKRFAYVVPLDKRLSRDLLIADGDQGDATDGDVVVARYVTYGEGSVGPSGEVETVLGKLSDPGVDVLAVAHSYGLSMDFPKEVLRAADAAARSGVEEPGLHRVDRTDLLVFTIDPADAKDHDDALSIRDLDGGRSEVGIHIADVSHFVREGGAVDLEAQARGTSVYLVDRTVPMLPEQLSGDVCSLRAGVERFALSLFVTLDRRGEPVSHRFERTVLESRHRLSYEQVQQVLDGEGSVDESVDAAVRALDDVARRVRARRFERGALDLDLPEAKVLLDAEGYPLDIQRQERLEAHRLVEDFMILANEVVAREAEARGLPVLYRVHEPPTRQRAEELADFLARFGLRLPTKRAIRPRDVQGLLKAVAGRREQHLINTVVLRSMKRARYDSANLGHFGLGSTAYLHFTSPIRRYPDLVVHRAIVRTLIEAEAPREWEEGALQSVADGSSAREQAATDAERESIALKKVEFMERHLGDEFDGRISGVQAFGFFVTLEAYFVDGLVHVNSLRDDFYRFKEGDYMLVGDSGRRRFRLGDRVRVQVTRVDKEAKHVDFVLVRNLPPEV